MALPVSMEDDELFPRRAQKMTKSNPVPSVPNINLDISSEMLTKLDKLWWSRLIIATRGYICNLYGTDNEETLFAFDDFFILAHRRLVEGTRDEALLFLSDLSTIQQLGLECLAELASGYQITEEHHPFYTPRTRLSFRRVFGLPSMSVYVRAYKQAVAASRFADSLRCLTDRWQNTKGKRKGVKFDQDTEWQPDDRVVVFQNFYQGNRTWVLSDFDRHILEYHRPIGVNVIFGDRYLQCKLDDGFRLCSYCGMMEQALQQFATCPQCPPKSRNGRGAACYCSAQCLNADLNEHIKQHEQNETSPTPKTQRNPVQPNVIIVGE